MKITWGMVNILTICGWGGLFVVTGLLRWFQQGLNELSIVYMLAPFILFLLYFVHVKIPLKHGNDYEIGGFISLNCLACALFFTNGGL